MTVKNRIKYGFILLISAILLLFYHNFFFFYLMLVVALMPLLSYCVSKYVWNRFDILIDSPVLTVGSKNDIPIDFVLNNRTGLPMPGVHFDFTVENHYYPNDELQCVALPVRAGKSTYHWSVNSVYAGKIGISGIEIRMRDYLGLFTFRRKFNCEDDIYVIPTESDVIMNVIEDTFTEGDDQDNDSGYSVDDVTQIKEFREFIPGDRMQKVNWKISAKHDELYVKEYEQQYNRTLTLLVELRRDSEEVGFLDELITAFYSAAVKLLDMDMVFRVQWYDIETGRFLTETVSEQEDLEEALHQMYLMSTYTDYFAYEHYREEERGKGDMAIYFTSPSFGGYDESKKIGTYKERVALICL